MCVCGVGVFLVAGASRELFGLSFTLLLGWVAFFSVPFCAPNLLGPLGRAQLELSVCFWLRLGYGGGGCLVRASFFSLSFPFESVHSCLLRQHSLATCWFASFSSVLQTAAIPK